jgi:hypothetical protein
MDVGQPFRFKALAIAEAMIPVTNVDEVLEPHLYSTLASRVKFHGHDNASRLQISCKSLSPLLSLAGSLTLVCPKSPL